MINVVLSRRTKSGFALAGALALLAICAALSVFFLKMFNLGQEDLARDALSEKAYQAARAGIDFGAYQTLINNTCVSSTRVFPGIAEMNVSLSCQRVSTSEGGVTVTIDTWTALACSSTSCPGVSGPGYVERQVRISVAK